MHNILLHTEPFIYILNRNCDICGTFVSSEGAAFEWERNFSQMSSNSTTDDTVLRSVMLQAGALLYFLCQNTLTQTQCRKRKGKGFLASLF